MIFQRSALLLNHLKKSLAPSLTVIMSYPGVRSISSMEITKNITLLSKEKKRGKIVDFVMEDKIDRPLVVMLCWLLAKKKHIFKYADFYFEKGYDVVTVNITPWQLLWPMRGTQVVAADVLKFLDKNRSYAPLVLHGFSVGGYFWSEVLVQVAAERQRYQHILDRCACQVWDSLADITEIPEGFPFAVFPNNLTLQTALRRYIEYHMKTFDKVATCHYVRGSQMFHTNIVKAPALFFVSKSDPVGSEKSNLSVKEDWESIGIPVQWKCWENSPHVCHFSRHREEYTNILTKFLEDARLKWDSQHQQLMRARAKL